MGFDLSGVNPKINKDTSQYKYYDKDTEIWRDNLRKINSCF